MIRVCFIFALVLVAGSAVGAELTAAQYKKVLPSLTVTNLRLNCCHYMMLQRFFARRKVYGSSLKLTW